MKNELLKKTNEMYNQLAKVLETNIVNLYLQAMERYNKMFKSIDKRLNTPEELVEMDKIKANLVNDVALIQKEFDDAYKVYFYLFSSDHIFTENLINKTEEMIKRHLKYKKDYEE